MDNVFDKVRTANSRDVGVELPASDVWLLMEVAGEALGEAEGRYDHWKEVFDDYERVKRREGKRSQSDSQP